MSFLFISQHRWAQDRMAGPASRQVRPNLPRSWKGGGWAPAPGAP